MATGTIQMITPVENGGTNSTTWRDAAAALNFLSGTTINTSVEQNLDTALDTVMRVRTRQASGSATAVNPELQTALGGTFAYVIQIFYSAEPNERSTSSVRMQVAFPYNMNIANIAFRTYVSSWGAWHTIAGS